jgi:glucose uptake protein GlcU
MLVTLCVAALWYHVYTAHAQTRAVQVFNIILPQLCAKLAAAESHQQQQ